MRAHKAQAIVSSCDGEDCGIRDCPGCAACDGGYLVVFCCDPHAERAQSVGGSAIEYPSDGDPYACLIGPSYSEIERELESDGFAVTEGD